MLICQYFANCTNEATLRVDTQILQVGRIPACERCVRVCRVRPELVELLESKKPDNQTDEDAKRWAEAAAEAFMSSGMTVREWNALSEENRLLRVDEFLRKPEE